MGPGPGLFTFFPSFFLASKAPPWTSFFCEFFIENGVPSRNDRVEYSTTRWRGFLMKGDVQ